MLRGRRAPPSFVLRASRADSIPEGERRLRGRAQYLRVSVPLWWNLTFCPPAQNLAPHAAGKKAAKRRKMG